MNVQVRVDPSLQKVYPGFLARYAKATRVKVEKAERELKKLEEDMVNELRSRYQNMPVTEIPEVVLFRSFFRAMGVDPSRFRSPPEYLVRRILSGRLPSVNNLVDVCLILTAKHWVAVGAFDLRAVKGLVTVTTSHGSETITTIDGRTVALTPGVIILRDVEKVISAYTVGDARETMVTESTVDALVTLWNAPGVSEQNLNRAMVELKELVASHASGVVDEIMPI